LDETTTPPELDPVEKTQRILKTPGAKMFMLMSAILGGIIGILILWEYLHMNQGMPIQVDCKTALAACKNILP
jgi:hypothetical protein